MAWKCVIFKELKFNKNLIYILELTLYCICATITIYTNKQKMYKILMYFSIWTGFIEHVRVMIPKQIVELEFWIN